MAVFDACVGSDSEGAKPTKLLVFLPALAGSKSFAVIHSVSASCSELDCTVFTRGKNIAKAN